ncbi:uncharacterized protein LOC121866771 [Homarus americanus]|uniref:uncharacterized protein LOC121866771 n=1 Tax=Homarus americanus TaxID=6706 RepID=UPI001C48F78B|nr:uncharacterized protein LOC121866771 [Homarus americanus]
MINIFNVGPMTRYTTAKKIYALIFVVFISVGVASHWSSSGDVAAETRATSFDLLSPQHMGEDSLAWVVKRAEGPMSADDPEAIRLLRGQYIHPPSYLPYNLKESEENKDFIYLLYKTVYPSWAFTDSILKDLFGKEQPAGFFVEAGALDGEYLSNTLWLERHRGWTGLLVEAEPDSYATLRKKHRRAWSSPACLAIKPYPHTTVITSFRRKGRSSNWKDRGAARIEEKPAMAGEGPGYKTYHTAQCFPAVTFLLALNVTRVHFFSLDVEGVEMGILHSFPFDRITVDVWAIEHIGSSNNVSVTAPKNTSVTSSGGSSEVSRFEDPEFIAFMEAQGYYLFDMFCHVIEDYVFIRRDSEVFRRLRVPRHLWRRRGICLNKTIWDEHAEVLQLKLLRDSRHWPNIVFSDIS